MTDIAIRVENLGKMFRLGAKRERYRTFRDTVSGLFRRPHRRKERARSEPFWALKDVSFAVRRGEVVGVIGRNGAGKSTLLKVLSRITEPTEGFAEIHGRIGSLLEVGTGFHPELTGRENVFLNGAILGMRRAEIEAKFDEIVAFAEVEKFIDMPVKHYSSGMYLRLAFAVAANLEPEILLVDEVLAVGDAGFQKKCLGKMGHVAKQGRTVLFVSHNMSAVQALCGRCALLRNGALADFGPTPGVVDAYLHENAEARQFSRSLPAEGPVKLLSAEIVAREAQSGLAVSVALRLHANAQRTCTVDLRLADLKGQAVAFGSLGTLDPAQLVHLRPGINEVNLAIPTQDLAVGSYSVSLDLTHPNAEYYDRVEGCLMFDVARPPRAGAIRVLDQKWGYGCMELRLKQL